MTSALHVVDLITTDKDKKFEPPGRMASTIIDLTNKNGLCMPEDLIAEGFTLEELNEYWHLACAVAGVEMSLIERTPEPPILG